MTKRTVLFLVLVLALPCSPARGQDFRLASARLLVEVSRFPEQQTDRRVAKRERVRRRISVQKPPANGHYYCPPGFT